MNNTARLGMPLLIPGQGQKDVTHNEALLKLDMLVQPVAQSARVVTPPVSALRGQCWIVPADAEGDWQDKEGTIAYWFEGGWRFAEPGDGWTLWLIDEGVAVRRSGGAWLKSLMVTNPLPPIPVPTSGGVIDEQARSAIATIIQRLADLGLVEQ